jgi:hypothetical protein
MEWYYQEGGEPDGEIAVKSVTLQDSRKDAGSGEQYHIYQVVTEKSPAGFPVAVVMQDGNWKVDWGNFAEFQGDHFDRFAKGEGDPKGTFHVLVRLTNFAPTREGFAAFRIDPPMPGRERYGFVAAGSELQERLNEHTAWGKPGQVLMRLQRHDGKDGKDEKPWLEITGIQMADWWSRSE